MIQAAEDYAISHSPKTLNMKRLMANDRAEWDIAGRIQSAIDTGLLEFDNYRHGIVCYRLSPLGTQRAKDAKLGRIDRSDRSPAAVH